MEIKILNPAHGGMKRTTIQRAKRLVHKRRAIWSGDSSIKLICGERRIIPNRLPIQQSPSTDKGLDTRGRFPALDAPRGVWTFRPVAV